MAFEGGAKLRGINLGDLPVECLAKIGLTLKAGIVHFSIAAQKHAMMRHPSEYELCVPHLAQAVANPTYVGQAPDHKNKGFELVLHVQKDNLIVLMAIHLKPSKNGIYI